MNLNNFKFDKSHKGFTLVELMVVIAIVAVLSAVGFVLYSNSQLDARDARRKADIDSIAQVIEQTKGPNNATYQPVVATSFVAQAVPADSTSTTWSATYTICYNLDGNPLAAGTTPPALNLVNTIFTQANIGTVWPATQANPVSALFNNYCANQGGGIKWSTMAAAKPVASTVNWAVCARLERPAVAATDPVVYCRTNSQ